MGRSKFPGKPSKHVNRTRINVLCTPLDTTTVGDTNNVVTVETDDSKQINITGEPLPEKQKSVKADKHISKPVPRKKQRTRLVNKRTALKRNGILPSVSSKISSINQVPRRTRSAVTARRPIRNFSNIRKVPKPKHSVSPTKESNNLVGKFVLPSRSVHSSRVIKPNKRFINVESNEARAFKKRVVNKRLCIRESEEKCPPDKNTIKESVDNETNDVSSVHSKGKVVLRQARLQLHTQSTSSGPEGPFSTNISNTVSPPGTVTCGVCGAVRFYRFVKQARKFNIYSCESCRKFISKMIKRHQSNLTALVCHKGQGMCHVPPIVRSQQWKLFRCAYRARCPACWLKMCLRSFQMPTALKNSLAQLLPKNMQTCDSLFSNPLPLLSWQSNLENTSEKPVISTNGKATEESTVRRRPVRLKAVKRDTKPTVTLPVSEIKRQKVDLKGPRVKHVCRSASIVLGQPLATFPTDNTKRNGDIEEKIDSKKIIESKEAKISTVMKENLESDKIRSDDDTSSNSSSEKQSNFTKTNTIKTEMILKKDKSVKNVIGLNTATEVKPVSYVRKNAIEHCNTISIDFWENYDPDEICKSGFGLTSSEIFPMQAICFLCGSAGQETLLHCLICCEPYHSYCLEQAPVNFIEYNEKYNWLCPRCTTCEACGQADKQKINCMKCHKAYHPNCFNTLWKRDDKPTLCSNCLRCKSCGTDSITKFVGNFALCHVCFKLRNKGNYCPLCQKCYDDNDFDTKMMECGKCRKWVHAKCETLADEQYQILSLLPESVEFLCTRCCNQSTPFWREAIQNELKSSFNNVLKLLSKNRVARNMLKLSPYKNNNPNNRTATLGRRIQFQDDENGDINENKELNGKLLCRRLSFESQDNTIVDARQESKSPLSSTIVDIKNKLNSNEYISLQDFNTGMEHALESADSDELLKIYRAIVKDVFPWYDPTHKEDTMNVKKSPFENHPLPQSSLFDSIKLFDYDMGKGKGKVDNRVCGLCKLVGDGLPHKEARLLYCGQNEWVHANCALWSSEVYEEIDGSLQNVHSALSRGRLIKCAHCKQKGASVGCCEKGCHETYHFTCALDVNCYFLHDKTVYCHSHELTNKNLLTNPSDFDIRRSVYVELDRKRKKYSEPDKVHFMVGSLSVTSLGKIIPVLSDDFDALVPLGFTCTRLFWSTSEPWKLIPYYISTSILNAEINNICVDKNFTVDHSLPKQVVDKKLKEILLWQRDLLKETLDLDFEEEPQNTADLLTPELTDAIFEELPHDFLDGISVQDVLMYEELLNMDFKSEINYNDNNLVSNNEQSKKTETTEEVESESKNSRELKRSKSEVFNQFGNVDKLNKNRSHQRSCSLTWSCKLDNSLTPTIKKRKIATRDSNMYFQLLQVDGAYDSSSSECGSPIHETEGMWSYETIEEPVTCERCQCTYRTRASYKRHLATCDALSTSESDSEEQTAVRGRGSIINTDAPIYLNVSETGEPNLIASYESFSSYQATQNEVHSTIMNTQTLVTAEATSEVIAVPDNTGGVLYPTFQQQVVEQKTATLPVITHPGITINDLSSIPISQPTITINQSQGAIEESTHMQANRQQATFCINQQPICVNPSNTLSLNHAGLISLDNSSITLNQSINPITINQNGTLPINQVEIQQPVTIQSLPFTSDVTPLINISPQNQITIDAKMLATPCTNLVNSVVAQTMTMPQTPWVKPIVKPSVITQKAIRPRGKPRSLAAKRSRLTAGNTIIVPPSSTATPVILQHLPSSNMVPTFVDAFQQQPGQNLQYVTTITPQINSTMAPQTQLVQIQPDNNFLSLVPGVQPTMIIQQPRVVTDQLIVDGNGSMMWATQPVYYGFETIVQNTVMQSQQFLPTTMNGVLTTNSSYSATTQVFQTSKLEPVLDVAQGGFVLVNSGQIVNPSAIQVPSQISQNIQAQNLNNTHIPVASQHNKMQTWSQAEPINTTAAISDIQMQTVQAKSSPSLPTSTNNLHSITLPLAPFVPEQGIPTNIVTPTPKPPILAQSRPMSRVLPMQTNVAREHRKVEEKIVNEKPIECAKETAIIASYVKPKVTILENEIIKEPNEIINEKVTLAKPETQIKLTLPKIVEKSNNNFPPKSTTQPIQVASLKPIVTETKSNIPMDPVPEEKIEVSLPVPTVEEQEPVPFAISELAKVPSPPCEQKLSQEKLVTPPSHNGFPKSGSSILYTVETRDGFRYSSTSIYELWSKVFETVQDARAAHNMPPLPANALDKINNLQLLGLKTNGLRYLLEQLPGASKCTKYKPSFYTRKVQDDSDDDIDVTNSSGSIRTIPYVRKKEPYDMFGWLASKHRKPENCVIDSDLLPRRGSVTNLPMAMRFRQLKLTSKVSVGVYRSNIHRRGLFSLRDIESGEMVIEYAGEVIRSVVTDKREKYYNSKGIGCYMFRIDDNLVVDATMRGNAARFINHSCDPNCYSKVVEIHGHKHIIIFALRRILCGEELTYDYKFPFEEDKIPCTCGARRCRKFLN